MSKRPDWRKTNVPWEQKVIIWEYMAKGSTDSEIERDLEFSGMSWHGKTIGKVRTELAKLPSEIAHNLPPQIRSYWESLKTDTKASDTGTRSKSNLALFLGMKEAERHLTQMSDLRERLKSEIWTPPLSHIPKRDLSVGRDAALEHTVHWEDADNGSLIIKLPVEDEKDFRYFKQHTSSLKLWDDLLEWKCLGGFYIRSRAGLLNAIRGDIERETGMQIVPNDDTRGILEGFSHTIFWNLFPQSSQDAKKRSHLAKEAILADQESRWYEAANINKKILDMYPDDLESTKRLGKAFTEMRQYETAKELYSRALEIDHNDIVAQKSLEKLKEDCKDDNGIASIDGGRYRVDSKLPDLWLVSVFTDDHSTSVAWAYPKEIDMIIAVFRETLRKYRSSHEMRALLKTRTTIEKLERALFRDLKTITVEMLAGTKCAGCPGG